MHYMRLPLSSAFSVEPVFWLLSGFILTRIPQAQENLRKWAKAKGGAVLPPMEEDELDNEVIVAPTIDPHQISATNFTRPLMPSPPGQVRFVGLFPELVGQMMETTLDEDSEEETNPDAGVLV